MLAREIVVQVLEPAVPDAIAAPPLIQSALGFTIGAKPFAPVIRLAAEHGHRLLFQQNGTNAVLAVADVGTVVASALRTLPPKLAREIPRRADAILLTLRRRSFSAVTLRWGQS